MIDLYEQIREVDREFFSRISQIYREADEIYFVDLSNGYRILLGNDNIEDKIRRYNFVEKNRKFEKGSVIDLRFKNKLIVRSEG
jgi:cell division septal protein FtsQ